MITQAKSLISVTIVELELRKAILEIAYSFNHMQLTGYLNCLLSIVEWICNLQYCFSLATLLFLLIFYWYLMWGLTCFVILVQVKRVNHVTNFSPQSFMFESSLSLKSTTWALKTCEKVDDDYWKCWQNLPKLCNPNQK